MWLCREVNLGTIREHSEDLVLSLLASHGRAISEAAGWLEDLAEFACEQEDSEAAHVPTEEDGCSSLSSFKAMLCMSQVCTATAFCCTPLAPLAACMGMAVCHVLGQFAGLYEHTSDGSLYIPHRLNEASCNQ